MNRRNFIKNAALSSSYVLLLNPALGGQIASAETGTDPADGFFTPVQRSVLGKLCDHVFPDASKLGAVQYIETLLTAFDSNPPKIYAGGPFSDRGRVPGSSGENSFRDFIPLNRYQEAAWRLKIYGDSGISGGSPNAQIVGAQKGLRNIILEGIEAVALKISNTDAVVHWALLSSECKNAIRELTIEACFSAPEYGGNINQEGWKLVHYRGDVLPRGYSRFNEETKTNEEYPDLPVSNPDSEKDPEPLSFSTQAIFRVVSTFTGKVFY